MSGIPASDHQHQHGTAVRWLPLLMAAGLVAFTLLSVTFAKVTGHGVVRTGANAIVDTGHIAIRRDASGTIHVVDPATDTIIASYPRTREQFLAGALRSLERMRGPASEESTRTFAVLRIGSGSVFLEDVGTGDRISLNAFNRAESMTLAERVAAHNGGRK
jgi:putative photosynthetic complex assembly protein